MTEMRSRYRKDAGVSLIDLRLNTIHQLFNSLDPSPFHDKDLDADAEDYIVGATREFPLNSPLRIVLHMPADQLTTAGAANVEQSVHNYFDYRHELAQRDLRYQLHLGRVSLAIGLAFLAACLAIREILLAQGGTMLHVIAESLLIAGWVAMWRPIEIFLYDWWPIRRMARIYRKLSSVPIQLARSDSGPGHPDSSIFSEQASTKPTAR